MLRATVTSPAVCRTGALLVRTVAGQQQHVVEQRLQRVSLWGMLPPSPPFANPGPVGSTARVSIEEAAQRREVHRLHEVGGEARLAGVGAILLAAVAGH